MDQQIGSGNSWHSGRRKTIALANAAHAFESQFDVTIDVEQALKGVGAVNLVYWANGDDDGVVVTLANSGDKYWFDEQSGRFELIREVEYTQDVPASFQL